MSSPTKDLNDIRRLAESQGWEITVSGGGHLRWHPPDGSDFIATSSTPSDGNIIKTIKQDLANAGLILNKSEAKKIMKDRNTDTSHLSEDTILRLLEHARTGEPATDDDLILDTIRDLDPDFYSTIEHVSKRKNIFCKMIREWPEGAFPTECATCDKEYADPFGLAMHVFSMRPNHEPLFDEDRSTDTPDDDAEGLDCPFCPTWFYLSQEADLDNHTRGAHGEGKCPYCDEYYFTSGLKRHMKECLESLQEEDEVKVKGNCGPKCQGKCVASGARQINGRTLHCEPPQVQSEPPPTPPARHQPAVAAHNPEPALPVTTRTSAATQQPTDDELFTLLEVVLDGPVMVTRESLAAINTWMNATRKLMALKEDKS